MFPCKYYHNVVKYVTIACNESATLVTVADEFYLIRNGDFQIPSRMLVLTELGMSEGVNFHWVLRGGSSSPVQFLKYEITSTVENPEIARVEYTGISSMDVFKEDSGKFFEPL